MSGCAARSPASSATAPGHCYFALKDADAVLDAVCWRMTALRLGLKPEDGMEVVCTGRLTTYPGRSKYQLVVETIELAGIGALLKLLEERRQRLAAEGLFAAERKKKLPFLPEVIGVVTSPTGAVIRDILHRLADRFPRRVLLWPVAVQGEGAAAQVAAAIDGLQPARRRADARAAPRPDHRRARRRQPRGSDGVQRGDRRARRRRLGDPADLGGRARDRHDPDRPCQRPPRADPDRGGRDGGAGAARPDRRTRRQGGAAGRRARPAVQRAPAAARRAGARPARPAGSDRRRGAAARRPRRAAAARRSAARFAAARQGLDLAAAGLRPAVLVGRCRRGRASASPRSSAGCAAAMAALSSTEATTRSTISPGGSRPIRSATRACSARGYVVVRDAGRGSSPTSAGINTGAPLELEFHDGRVGVVAGSRPRPRPRRAPQRRGRAACSDTVIAGPHRRRPLTPTLPPARGAGGTRAAGG